MRRKRGDDLRVVSRLEHPSDERVLADSVRRQRKPLLPDNRQERLDQRRRLATNRACWGRLKSSKRFKAGALGLDLGIGAASWRGPSSFSPLATICSASSGSGRCNSSAFGASAKSHKSTSAGVVRMTGIAFGLIGATTAFASVVTKPKTHAAHRLARSSVPARRARGSIDQRTRTMDGPR